MIKVLNKKPLDKTIILLPHIYLELLFWCIHSVPLKRMIVDLAIRLPFPLSAYRATHISIVLVLDWWLLDDIYLMMLMTVMTAMLSSRMIDEPSNDERPVCTVRNPTNTNPYNLLEFVIAELTSALNRRWRGRSPHLQNGRHPTRTMFVNTTLCYLEIG